MKYYQYRKIMPNNRSNGNWKDCISFSLYMNHVDIFIVKLENVTLYFSSKNYDFREVEEEEKVVDLTNALKAVDDSDDDNFGDV